MKRILFKTIKTAWLTLALLIVGDHHNVKRRLGIWFKPDLWALVNFLYFIDSSKPLAFSLKWRYKNMSINELDMKTKHTQRKTE